MPATVLTNVVRSNEARPSIIQFCNSSYTQKCGTTANGTGDSFEKTASNLQSAIIDYWMYEAAHTSKATSTEIYESRNEEQQVGSDQVECLNISEVKRSLSDIKYQTRSKPKNTAVFQLKTSQLLDEQHQNANFSKDEIPKKNVNWKFKCYSQSSEEKTSPLEKVLLRKFRAIQPKSLDAALLMPVAVLDSRFDTKKLPAPSQVPSSLEQLCKNDVESTSGDHSLIQEKIDTILPPDLTVSSADSNSLESLQLLAQVAAISEPLQSDTNASVHFSITSEARKQRKRWILSDPDCPFCKTKCTDVPEAQKNRNPFMCSDTNLLPGQFSACIDEIQRFQTHNRTIPEAVQQTQFLFPPWQNPQPSVSYLMLSHPAFIQHITGTTEEIPYKTTSDQVVSKEESIQCCTTKITDSERNPTNSCTIRRNFTGYLTC